MAEKNLSEEVEGLLEEAQEKASRYSSAHYSEGEVKSGLAIRLEAIEEALRRLASAADQSDR